MASIIMAYMDTGNKYFSEISLGVYYIVEILISRMEVAKQQHQGQNLEQKLEDKTLYAILDIGDMTLVDLGETAVILVGKTKGGKSTTMQWMLSKTLIGHEDESEGIPTYSSQQENAAEIGKGFVSDTLVLNCVNIKPKGSKKSYSVGDMAGYEDNRDFKGIIVVSYMLKAVMEKAKQVKFVIVASAPQFQDANMKTAMQSFTQFVKMFDFAPMSSQMRQSIYESTTLLLSRCKPTLHQSYPKRLTKLLQGYKNSKLSTPQKPYVVELLEHILSKNKITYFDAAVDGQTCVPETCPLVQKLEDEGWTYLNLPKLKLDYEKIVSDVKPTSTILEQNQKKSKDGILLPYQFPKDKKQQANFEQVINQKQNFYPQFSELIESFIQKATSKLNLYSKNVNYGKCWEKFDQFLIKHDYYSQKNNVDHELYRLKVLQWVRSFDQNKPNRDTLFGVEFMNQLQKLYQHTLFIELSPGNGEKEQFQELKNHLLSAVKTFKEMFCQNYQHQTKLIKLSYIILRSFREIRMLREIDPERFQQPGVLASKITSIDLKELSLLKLSFITDQTQNFKKMLKENSEARQEMVEFILAFKDKNGDLLTSKASAAFAVEMCLIELYNEKAKGFIRQEKYLEGLEVFLRLLHSIKELSVRYELECNNDDKFQEKLGENVKQPDEMFIQVYENIAELLKRFNTSSAYRYAKNCYQYISYIEPACECWEKMAEMESNQEQKCTIWENYGEFCLKNGRIERYILCLQQAYRFAHNKSKRAEVKDRYNEVIQDLSSLYENSGQNTQIGSVAFHDTLADQIEYFIHEMKHPLQPAQQEAVQEDQQENQMEAEAEDEN